MNHTRIKDVIGEIFASLIIVAIVAVVVLMLYYIDVSLTMWKESRYFCIENGYPDLIGTKDGYYCHKLENGNDVIVSVESLRDDRLK